MPGGGPAGESRAAWALLPGPRSVAAYGAGPCSPKFIPLIQAISAAEPTIRHLGQPVQGCWSARGPPSYSNGIAEAGQGPQPRCAATSENGYAALVQVPAPVHHQRRHTSDERV